eukprot:472691-Pyramimonas_sp.AAC.1
MSATGGHRCELQGTSGQGRRSSSGRLVGDTPLLQKLPTSIQRRSRCGGREKGQTPRPSKERVSI